MVLDYLAAHVPDGQRAPLAGNTIGTDRMFLARYMPRFDTALHYPRRTMTRDAYRHVDEQCRRAARDGWRSNGAVYLDARAAAYLDLDSDETVIMSDGRIECVGHDAGSVHVDLSTAWDRLLGYDVNPLLSRSEAKAMEGGE